MKHVFRTLHDFMTICSKRPAHWLRFSISPGGAAVMLGVSRQRVFQLMEAGQLDYVRTHDGYMLLDMEAVQRRADRRRPKVLKDVKRPRSIVA